MNEDVEPAELPGKPPTAPVPKDRGRHILLIACTVFLGLVLLVGAVGWWTGRPLNEWVSFTTPVFTLAGAVLAFYFKED